MATRRVRWWTHGGRARSVAVRLPETRGCDNGVRLHFRHVRRRPSLIVALWSRTCFWAGDTFAPKLRVLDGVPIQHFLQDAFLDMWETVVRAVGDLDGVLGFEVRPPFLLLIGPFDLSISWANV
jgi:hypothetical protein